jgi:hypothetical protein
VTQSGISQEKIIEAMADLLFAYMNKDEDFPHSFEVEAVSKAADILMKEYKGNQYSKEFFQKSKEMMLQKING